MRGRSEAEAAAAMLANGVSPDEATRLAPHRTFPGNRPSITIAYAKLDPFTLGRIDHGFHARPDLCQTHPANAPSSA